MSYRALCAHYLRRPQPHSRFPAAVDAGAHGALLDVPASMQLATSSCRLVSGADFPHRLAADEVAALALCRALAPVAAFGALPAWVQPSVSLPRPSRSWVRAFARRFYALADAAQIEVVDAALGPGPLVVQLGTHGLVEHDMALSRHGARPGDQLFVTGHLGGAALARRQLERGEQPDPCCLARLRAPMPRLGVGRALLGLATSACALRRGLKRELASMLRAGGLGATLALDALPMPPAVAALGMAGTELALFGDGDGELLFSAPASAAARLAALAPALGELSCIGVVEAEPGLRGRSARAAVAQLPGRHFRHISSPEDVLL